VPWLDTSPAITDRPCRIFFQPVKLDLELTNLLKQFCFTALELFADFVPLFGEHFREIFDSVFFSFPDHHRMNSEVLCDLVHRLDASDRFKHHLALISAPYFCRFFFIFPPGISKAIILA